MPIDLSRAETLIAKTELWQLDDKLEAAYDEPIGEVLWALHDAGLLDCSQKDSWWSAMTDAEGCYDAAKVVQLLLAAGAHPDMGGLIEGRRGRKSGLAWNIYCHIFVENTLDDAATLIEGMRQAPRAMQIPWALELAAHGKLDAAQLPEGVLEGVAPAAVREVGHQAWYEKLAKVFPPEVHGPALCAAAATENAPLWNLTFMRTAVDYATPELLASIALNIDYDSAVEQMIAILDAHPDGVEEQLIAQLQAGRGDSKGYREGPGGRLGKATAAAWVGARALAEERSLHPAVCAAMRGAADQDTSSWKVLAPVFAAQPVAEREAWLLEKFDSWNKPWGLLASTPTESITRRAVEEVRGYKQRDLNRAGDAKRSDLAALGAACAAPLVEALSGKKLPARELLAEGLSHSMDPEVVPTLVKLLADSKEAVRDAAAAGLARQGALDAIAKALRSRKKDVRLAAALALSTTEHPDARTAAASALEAGADDDVTKLLAPVAGTAEPLPVDIQDLRATVSEEAQATWDKAWRNVRWRDAAPASLVPDLAAALGDDLLATAYDGLYRSHGKTRDKLAIWHAVLERSPVDEATASLAVQMLSGWPLDCEPGKFDDSPALHRAAIEDGWRWIRDRYGDLAHPQLRKVLDDADDAGLTAAWIHALSTGLPGAADRVAAMAVTPEGASARLVLALETLGDAALPGVRAALAHKKAEVRIAVAEALVLAPRAALLPDVEGRKERSGKVRHALAAAGLACASVGARELASDPDCDARLARFPGELPKGCDPAVLPRLAWEDGTALSDGAFAWVLGRLGAGSHRAADPLLQSLRPRFQPRAAQALLEALRGAYAGQKVATNGWVLFATAVLADPASLTDYGTDLDEEARYGSSAVAFYKIEILRRHGAPAAVRWIDHWSRNARSQGLQARAEAALLGLAEARGTTLDAIADEVVADFGLDAEGRVTLPYGGRTLTVAVAPDGAIVVEREDGKALKSLPKARAEEDADEVAAHKRAITALKKQLKATLSSAVERLEQAMVTGRRWDRALFDRTWGGHPVLKTLARRVWWGVFTDEGPPRPVRLDGDALVGFDGAPVADGSTLGVLHPLELDEAIVAGLRTLDLRSPFPQLQRPTFEVEASEVGRKRMDRYEDAKVSIGRLRSTLERRRWVRGEPQDAGHVSWFTKAFPRAGVTVKVHLEPGFPITGDDWASGEQSIDGIEFLQGVYGRRDLPWRAEIVKVGDVDPIVYSEVRADLTGLLAG